MEHVEEKFRLASYQKYVRKQYEDNDLEIFYYGTISSLNIIWYLLLCIIFSLFIVNYKLKGDAGQLIYLNIYFLIIITIILIISIIKKFIKFRKQCEIYLTTNKFLEDYTQLFQRIGNISINSVMLVTESDFKKTNECFLFGLFIQKSFKVHKINSKKQLTIQIKNKEINLSSRFFEANFLKQFIFYDKIIINFKNESGDF